MTGHPTQTAPDIHGILRIKTPSSGFFPSSFSSKNTICTFEKAFICGALFVVLLWAGLVCAFIV
ncbi:hypothetical protein K402DRAFT_396065, partial [Aulographum hederae CBS 113979]